MLRAKTPVGERQDEQLRVSEDMAQPLDPLPVRLATVQDWTPG